MDIKATREADRSNQASQVGCYSTKAQLHKPNTARAESLNKLIILARKVPEPHITTSQATCLCFDDLSLGVSRCCGHSFLVDEFETTGEEDQTLKK